MDNKSDQLEQQDNEHELVKKTIQVFAELCDIMPPIGFISHKKRLTAYITVTTKAQSIIDSNQINEGEMLFVFSMMVRKKKDFQKAAMMTALSLPKLNAEILSPVGFKFVNDIRVNMQLSPVDNKTSTQF